MLQGNQLLIETDHDKCYLHQTWKSHTIPPQYEKAHASWKAYNQNIIQVLWDDTDNDKLVSLYYPELLNIYKSLELPIQRADFARMLYLHKYGGVYVDMDFECYSAIPAKYLEKQDKIYFNQGAVAMSEVYQNALMIAINPGNDFWLDSIDMIRKSVESVKDINWFAMGLTKKYANIFATVNLTGPNIIDKTIANNPSKFHEIVEKLEDIQWGEHHNTNSWCGIDQFQDAIILIVVILLILCLLCMLGGYLIARR